MGIFGLLLGAGVGAFIGVMGGGGGAIVGAVVGGFVGFMLLRRPGGAAAGSRDERLDTIEDAIRQLNARLKALESRGGPAPDSQPVAAAAQALEQTVAEIRSADTASAPTAPEPLPASAFEAPAPEVLRAAAGPDAPPRENFLVRWFTGPNALVRVGVTLLFFGVAFLLKYAAENDLVPIELRLAGVAGGGIALLVIGWRLRRARAGYAVLLQGAGVGVLYLVVFAGLRLYQLIPAELAFALLTAIAVFSAVMAVAQDARALAIAGAAGGFLAPVLASTGSGNHVALFGFYAVLNAGIVFIAWHKAWRLLNLVGFGFTFVIGLAWGAQYYRPELYASTQPFLALFFLMYVAIAVMFSLREAPRLLHYVDGTIVFGTPVIAFGLQTGLVRGIEFGAAWSALALGAFYLLLASALYRRGREPLRLLVESFLALGVGFATLAVPLAFDGRLTSAVWAVEGAAIVWVSVRQGRVLGRAFGMVLQIAAGFAFLAGADRPADPVPVLNSLYLGSAMVSLAALFSACYLARNAGRVHEAEGMAGRLLFIWGALWWFCGGVAEIVRQATGQWGLTPYLLFFAGSCFAFGWIGRRIDWYSARRIAPGAVPLSALVIVLMAVGFAAHRHPFAFHGWAGWLAVFAAHLWALRMHEAYGPPRHGWLHAMGFWMLTVVLSWEAAWQIDHYVEGRRVWPMIAWAIVPGALIALFAARGDRFGWPVGPHARDYLYRGCVPLVVCLLAWIVWVNFRSNGDPAPLPYVPLLNPLDIAQAAALLAAAAWYAHLRRLELAGVTLPAPVTALRAAGIVAFVALNGALLRALHHYAGVPFRLSAMWRSDLVQAAFSLFWTMLALAAMVIAARRASRVLWLTGAFLLAVVVAKLFLVDLANTGTVERVVSFIGVGVLVIVVGYFAPAPPRK